MIEINNLTTSRVDKGFLKRIAKKVLDGERKPADSPLKASQYSGSPKYKVFGDSAARRARQNTKFLAGKIDLSIAFVGPARIKELNKKYRKKNKATDVLSFLYDDTGEIVICLREVKKNAKRFTPLETIGAGKKNKESKSLTGFDSKFKTELARVLVHGILHLLGYDHENGKKDARIMEERQDFYLKKLVKL